MVGLVQIALSLLLQVAKPTSALEELLQVSMATTLISRHVVWINRLVREEMKLFQMIHIFTRALLTTIVSLIFRQVEAFAPLEMPAAPH